MYHVHANLWRGPRPMDLQKLKDEGFEAIISLQSGFHELFTEDAREWQHACDFGLKEYEIPLNDFTAPRLDKVRHALEIISRGQKTYIHCLHGVDRTGYVCAAYRMTVQGWSKADAVKEYFEMGFHKFPYLYWVPTLKRFESKVG